MKKLDKEQTQAVVDVIYNKVSPALIAKANKELEAEKAIVTKTMKAHPLYKEIVKILSMVTSLKLIIKVPSIYVAEMGGGTTQESFAYTIEDIKQLTDLVFRYSGKQIKFNEYKTKQDIKAQLVLASIDAVDLQQLIDSVVKLFK